MYFLLLSSPVFEHDSVNKRNRRPPSLAHVGPGLGHCRGNGYTSTKAIWTPYYTQGSNEVYGCRSGKHRVSKGRYQYIFIRDNVQDIHLTTVGIADGRRYKYARYS